MLEIAATAEPREVGLLRLWPAVAGWEPLARRLESPTVWTLASAWTAPTKPSEPARTVGPIRVVRSRLLRTTTLTGDAAGATRARLQAGLRRDEHPLVVFVATVI